MNTEKCISIERSIQKISDTLDDHIERFSIHEKEEKLMHDATQHNRTLNTEAINNLTNAQKELANAQKEQTHSTQGLVTAWESVSALVDALNAIGKVVKWVGGTAATVLAIVTLYKMGM